MAAFLEAIPEVIELIEGGSTSLLSGGGAAAAEAGEVSSSMLAQMPASGGASQTILTEFPLSTLHEGALRGGELFASEPILENGVSLSQLWGTAAPVAMTAGVGSVAAIAAPDIYNAAHDLYNEIDGPREASDPQHVHSSPPMESNASEVEVLNSPPNSSTRAPPHIDVADQVGTSNAADLTSSRPPKPNHAEHAGKFLKTGNNSLITTGNHINLLCQEAHPVSPLAGDFFRRNCQMPTGDNVNVYWDQPNHSIRFRSFLMLAGDSGAPDNPVEIAGVIFDFKEQQRAAANINLLNFRWAPAIAVGKPQDMDLASFRTGNVINERSVTSAIQPRLNLANIQVARHLTGLIDSGAVFHDNYGLYFKLLWSALLIEVQGFTNDDHTAAFPFPAGDDPVFINLDDGNLDYMLITNEILSGSIILVDRIDYCEQDLQVIMWLCKPGRRFDHAAGHHATDMVYSSFEALRVVVLNHGVAPAAFPVAAIPSANSIRAFALKLAQNRNEHDHFLRAMYAVADLAPTRLIDNAGGALDAHRTPFMSGKAPLIPRPIDFNVLLRLMAIQPPFCVESRPEIDAYVSCSAAQRVAMHTTYGALLMSFATTLFSSLSIRTVHLSNWTANNAAIPNLANSLFESGLFMPTLMGQGRPPREAVIYTQLKLAFSIYAGFNVPAHLYYADQFGGGRGSLNQVQATLTYRDSPAQIPPRLVQPWIVDDLVKVRPLEWGLISNHTTADLSHEVYEIGPPAQQGWYANLGSTKYGTTATSKAPYLQVVYGNQVINLIQSYTRAANMLLAQAQIIINLVGGLGQPNAPAAWVDNGTEYNVALHTLVPCTMMSFNMTNRQIIAPVLIGAALNAGNRHSLRALVNQPLTRVGLYQQSHIQEAETEVELPACLGGLNIGSDSAGPTPTGAPMTADPT